MSSNTAESAAESHGRTSSFGLLVAGTMWLIGRWMAHNTRCHRKEMARLLGIARRDDH